MRLPQILLIDDNIEEAFLIRRALARTRCTVEVVHARHPSEALPWLLEASPLPGLILVDVELPAINGFDIVAHLGRVPEWRDIPTILLTDDDQPGYRHQAQQTHARALFVKPQSSAGYQPLARTFRALLQEERPQRCAA